MLISGQQVAFFVYMSQNVLINTISKYKTFIYDPVETNVGIDYDVKSRTFMDPERELNLLNTSTTAYDTSHSFPRDC